MFAFLNFDTTNNGDMWNECTVSSVDEKHE